MTLLPHEKENNTTKITDQKLKNGKINTHYKTAMIIHCSSEYYFNIFVKIMVNTENIFHHDSELYGENKPRIKL